MKQYHPAVHHDVNKLCTISFRHRGKFVSLKNQRFKDRRDALLHVRSYYPGALNVSVVFFVPHPDTLPRVPRKDVLD